MIWRCAVIIFVSLSSFSARAEVVQGVSFVRSSSQVDFAELEAKLPIRPESLVNWTAADLRNLTQEQLDQLYARLKSGGAPEGAYLGSVLQISPLTQLSGFRARVLRSLAGSLWTGKVFETNNGQLVANSLVPSGLINRGVMKAAALALTGRDPRFDQRKQFQFRDQVFLEVLPSKVFLGQSLLDSRRESWILDFAYADTLSDYHSDFDALSTKRFLEMRDELREVHPGLYLGRAYIHQIFALSFMLTK